MISLFTCYSTGDDGSYRRGWSGGRWGCGGRRCGGGGGSARPAQWEAGYLWHYGGGGRSWGGGGGRGGGIHLHPARYFLPTTTTTTTTTTTATASRIYNATGMCTLCVCMCVYRYVYVCVYIYLHLHLSTHSLPLTPSHILSHSHTPSHSLSHPLTPSHTLPLPHNPTHTLTNLTLPLSPSLQVGDGTNYSTQNPHNPFASAPPPPSSNPFGGVFKQEPVQPSPQFNPPQY